jgi:hypothetical protein
LLSTSPSAIRGPCMSAPDSVKVLGRRTDSDRDAR